MESTHSVFNELLRRYGNTCGCQLKRLVIRQFLLERASFIPDAVDEMVKDTSRTKRQNTKKRGKTFTSQEVLRAEIQMHAKELTAVEVAMNKNEILHPVPHADDYDDAPAIQNTQMVVCQTCGRRLIHFGLDLHEHEYHSGCISNDTDEDVLRMMQEGAAI